MIFLGQGSPFGACVRLEASDVVCELIFTCENFLTSASLSPGDLEMWLHPLLNVDNTMTSSVPQNYVIQFQFLTGKAEPYTIADSPVTADFHLVYTQFREYCMATT